MYSVNNILKKMVEKIAIADLYYKDFITEKTVTDKITKD